MTMTESPAVPAQIVSLCERQLSNMRNAAEYGSAGDLLGEACAAVELLMKFVVHAEGEIGRLRDRLAACESSVSR